MIIINWVLKYSIFYIWIHLSMLQVANSSQNLLKLSHIIQIRNSVLECQTPCFHFLWNLSSWLWTVHQWPFSKLQQNMYMWVREYPSKSSQVSQWPFSKLQQNMYMWVREYPNKSSQVCPGPIKLHIKKVDCQEISFGCKLLFPIVLRALNIKNTLLDFICSNYLIFGNTSRWGV